MFHAPLASAYCFMLWNLGHEIDKEKRKKEYNHRYKTGSAGKLAYLKHTEKGGLTPDDYAKIKSVCGLHPKTVRRHGLWATADDFLRWRETVWLPAKKERLRLFRVKYRDKSKAYAVKTKERRRAYSKVYNEKNRGKKREYDSTYRPANKDRIRDHKNAWLERNRDNPKRVLTTRLRARLSALFRSGGAYKHTSCMKLVGCTREHLVFWIESQFTRGMTWERRSEIHIDHIIPVSSFDLTDLEQQKKCFHYTNLKPVWKTENLQKGRKIIPFKPVQAETFLGIPASQA